MLEIDIVDVSSATTFHQLYDLPMSIEGIIHHDQKVTPYILLLYSFFSLIEKKILIVKG